jgi:hypothetical protein
MDLGKSSFGSHVPDDPTDTREEDHHKGNDKHRQAAFYWEGGDSNGRKHQSDDYGYDRPGFEAHPSLDALNFLGGDTPAMGRFRAN